MAGLLQLIVTGGIGGVISSLLTVFLAPRLQHYFWKRQRRAELCLAAIDEITNLTSTFIANFTLAKMHESPLIFSREFYQWLEAADAKEKVLFSGQTYQQSHDMWELLRSAPEPGESQQKFLTNFSQARDAALLALYKEIGVIPRKLHHFRRKKT